MKIFNLIKEFVSYKIKYDNKFIKDLGVYNQKFIIYYIILLLLLYYLDIITNNNLLSASTMWILLLIYKIIVDMISYYLINNKQWKSYIVNNDNKFNSLLKILLFIQKWKNPLLILLLYIDKLFFKFLRFLVYKLKKNKWFSYKKSNLIIIFYIQYFIFNILLGPLKVILGFYYTMLCNIIDIPFSLFVLIRSFAFVLNIFIISYLIQFLYYTFGVKIYIFFYIILIIISVIIKIIDKDYKYIKLRQINLFLSTDYLIFIRNHSTICGLIIVSISLCKKENIDIKHIDIISSNSNTYIKDCFDKYWIFYKRNVLLGSINVWKEIKNRPSWFIYQTIIYWISLSPTSVINNPSFITEILYIKFKVIKLNIQLPLDIKENIDYLYNIDILRLKLLLYILWDIDNYIGNDNWNYVTYTINVDLFNIGCINSIFDYLDIDNFKVEENENDLLFYDVENNMKFFNKLYKVIGTPSFLENPFFNLIYNECLSDYIKIKEGLIGSLNNFYTEDPLIKETWLRIADNELDGNKIPLIEYKIKDWIIEFLQETRKEWLILIEKETIENRNIRLLNEIENLLKKNDNNI